MTTHIIRIIRLIILAKIRLIFFDFIFFIDNQRLRTIFAFRMIYRFKIWFEDMEDIVRWIEIKPSHTFLDFNNIIQAAIGFDNKELASFFVSDDRWRRISEVKKAKPTGDTDITGNANAPLMSETKLRTCVNDPHQRFIYVFDYNAQWTLLCELISIEESNEKQAYPRIYRNEGKAPRQHNEGKFKMLDDNEFDTLAEKILAAKGVKSLLVEHEEELLEEDDDDLDDDLDNEEEEDDHDEFDFGALGEGIDADDLK